MEGLIQQPPSGIMAWVSQYGQVVFFFAQIAYWLLLVVLLAYAVWQYKRWVNFQLGTGRSGKLRTEGVNEPESKPVSVEEFVD